MANIAALESLQMIICVLGGVMVLFPDLLDLTVNRVFGCLLLAVWIGLVYLRLYLAFSRFTTMTQYTWMYYLNTVRFHMACVVLCWFLALIALTICLCNLDGLFMDSQAAIWMYFHPRSPFRPFDKFSGISCAFLGFCLYLYTCGYILKNRTYKKASEIRLLITFAASFSYEIGNVLAFNVVPDFIQVSGEAFKIMSLCWILIPAFDCLMLLFINKNFRVNFFACCLVKKPQTVGTLFRKKPPGVVTSKNG
ncbi:hypothetical protein L596_016463 [Steinernema carpocapsae]|uniref:7TM GPCR serpentine receptor class x (Srx) domain-containing protein n=1 Tax=Steinernema carpocapsae TaxID=34508 RepID=A0A4U5NIX9_STECR|nr:hypothetical protein L596_016463 [Steinernema carpocapsae]